MIKSCHCCMYTRRPGRARAKFNLVTRHAVAFRRFSHARPTDVQYIKSVPDSSTK